MRRVSFWGVLGVCVMLVVCRVWAQADCGVADRLDFAIDQSQYQLVQDYGVASVRHQGRYHTGEDWVNPSASALQPVKAIADGRVTFADPKAWGADGGVVIIEHRFSDETIVYSMYGHINDSGAPFPDELTCVGIGQIIGNIASDVRPAPHLHFEIRTENPDTAGAGYTRETPASLGYVRPSEFIQNQQTFLRPSHLWHVRVVGGLFGTPVVLNDNSMVYIDGQNQLRRVLPDGRIFWREFLDKTAVSVSATQGTTLVTFSDGTVQRVNVEDGSLGDFWRIDDFAPVGAPFGLGDWLIYPQENALVAIDDTRRNILWRVDDIPPFQQAFVANEGANAIIGLVTEGRVWQIAGSGVLLGQMPVRYGASLAQHEDGDLLAYTWGGLWQIGVDGAWTELFDAPHGGTSGAVWRENGLTYVFDGAQLAVYGGENALLWQSPLANVSGRVVLARLNGRIALMSGGGTIAVWNEIGTLCNQTTLYARDSDTIWHNLGDDGVWRVAIGEWLVGFDWTRFAGGC
jgi:hypothetical protein